MSESAIREAVIGEHLRQLRLPGMAHEYPELARQAQDGGWAYEEFLHCLLEAEIRSRQERSAAHRMREAHFPDIKNFGPTGLEGAAGNIPSETVGTG